MKTSPPRFVHNHAARMLPAITVGCASLALAWPTSAAVIDDPALSGPGANTFDPPGNEQVDFAPSPSDSQATLETRSDIRSIQDFSGFVAGDNTFSFTDAAKPDIQLRLSGEAGGKAGRADNQGNLLTSAGDAYNIDQATDSGSGGVYTVDFGAYDSGSGMFDSNANSVAAAGFTLNQVGGPISYDIEFQTDSGTTLKTVTFSGDADPQAGNSGNADYFIGFDNGSTANIGQVVINRTGTTFSNGLDDLGFTVVPEPASLALLGLGSLCLLGRRRRARPTA